VVERLCGSIVRRDQWPYGAAGLPGSLCARVDAISVAAIVGYLIVFGGEDTNILPILDAVERVAALSASN
jgi:hypothetical protein